MTEILAVVDLDDNVVGSAPYPDVYAKKLPHRIVHVLLFNRDGEMLLQMRSKAKSFCPQHWVTAVGGHVQAGESYEGAALREFEEELGASAALTPAFRERYDGAGMPKFLAVFTARYNGDFECNPAEVERVEWFPMARVRAMLTDGTKLHPELRFILEKHYSR